MTTNGGVSFWWTQLGAPPPETAALRDGTDG